MLPVIFFYGLTQPGDDAALLKMHPPATAVSSECTVTQEVGIIN